MKGLLRLVKKTFAILIVFICIGASYQFVSTSLDNNYYKPPGQLVDIGGYRLHMLLQGKGDSTVVLDAGLGCLSLDWSFVQSESAKFAQVVSYDRAGYGWSDESPHPRTSLQMVDELHRLLERANLKKPYILVGHSFGGINIRLYENLYPDEVKALVFVDSCHERQDTLLVEDFENELIDNLTSWGNPYLGRFSTPLGISRILGYFSQVKQDLNVFPEEIQNKYLSFISSNQYARTVWEEDRHFSESLRQLEQSNRHLQNKPLIVITAGDPDDSVWNRLQKEIALLSNASVHFYAKESDHMIPWHEPQIIVEAIRSLCK